MRRGKVVLSKVRGDVNPADVLTKPKSLEDMKVLLNFACLDWCDGKVGDIPCSGNRIEFVNHIGNGRFEDSGKVSRYCFVNSPTVRRRGVLEFEQFVSDPTPKSPITKGPNMCLRHSWKVVGFGVGVESKRTHVRLAQDVVGSDMIKSPAKNCVLIVLVVSHCCIVVFCLKTLCRASPRRSADIHLGPRPTRVIYQSVFYIHLCCWCAL